MPIEQKINLQRYKEHENNIINNTMKNAQINNNA